MVTPGATVIDLAWRAKRSVNHRTFGGVVREHNVSVRIGYESVGIDMATGDPQSPTG